MDGIQHEYLRVNKYLLLVVSAWPYQTILQKSLIGIIFIPIVTAQLILQVSMHFDKYFIIFFKYIIIIRTHLRTRKYNNINLESTYTHTYMDMDLNNFFSVWRNGDCHNCW